MTSRIKSLAVFKFAVAIAVVGMIAVAGSVGAGNGEERFDVAAVLASADVAGLPVLHIVDPI